MTRNEWRINDGGIRGNEAFLCHPGDLRRAITAREQLLYINEKNYSTEMCSGCEEGPYSRRIYFVSLNSRLESNKEGEEDARMLQLLTTHGPCFV